MAGPATVLATAIGLAFFTGLAGFLGREVPPGYLPTLVHLP
ncbi:hypothetical protein [uncultured Paracoccus sp.]|nr:hypothetical protein [uncultured Paracoccus sp.]